MNPSRDSLTKASENFFAMIRGAERMQTFMYFSFIFTTGAFDYFRCKDCEIVCLT